MSLNVELLKETLERAKRENGGTTRLGLRFYECLFDKYPAVRPLFKTPPEEQHKKLMASVASIVASVTKPEEMLPYLHAMGIRHLAYGIENGHYPAVAENLLAVLAEHLSKEGEWTADMAETWAEALQIVANIMIEAANEPEKYTPELLKAGFLPNGFRTGDPAPWVLMAS
jgi:methyl-accepting chemotaxis protein